MEGIEVYIYKVKGEIILMIGEIKRNKRLLLFLVI